MGVVYEAFDRERNTRVALKTIRTLTASSLLRFKNEFRALQDLQHPNLVRLDELFEEGGTWFFTMEMVDGIDFTSYVRPNAPLRPARLAEATPAPSETPPTATPSATTATAPATRAAAADTGDSTQPTMPVSTGASLEAAARFPLRRKRADPAQRPPAAFDERRLRQAMRQLVRGIAALHDAGKVHRDVKPANIRVTAEGRVVLLDFGLVTDAVRNQVEATTVGTVTYMAPEQLAGASADAAADWYSVGVTLYLALTGKRPFSGDTEEVAARKQLVDPLTPDDMVTGVPTDLNDLCMQLLQRDPARRADGATALRMLGEDALEPEAALAPRAAAQVFVGREPELAILAGAFAEVQRGSPIALLVSGESGVGKSALVRQFLDAAAGPTTVTLAGRCYERESVPYKALDQVMDALGRFLARVPPDELAALLPEKIALVAGVFPALHQVELIEQAVARAATTAADAPRSLDPFHSRAAMFAALRELWTRLCRRWPLVVTIDDLQWADADSLSLLSDLTRAPAAPPFLLAVTVRTSSDARAHQPAALRTHLGENVRELHLERLPPPAARALVARLLAGSAGASAGTGATVAASVAEEAGGHPLFIEALVRHRLLHPESSGPLRLDEALIARAAALEPAAALVLTYICVAGGPIQQEACAHAAGVPFGDFGPLVATLRAANLVKTHGVRRSDSVEPYHDRVRESVVARLALDDVEKLHGRLAHALEAGGHADLELLAFHFHLGGDARRAARHAARAAEQALAALAFELAARLYRMALELNPGTPAHAQRLRVGLAEALGNSGRGRDSAEAYLVAAEEAPEHTSPAEKLELRRRAAEQLLMSGRIDEGLAVMRTVLDSVGMKMPETPRRALVSLLVNRARVRLRGGGLRVKLRPASEIAPALLARIDTCWSTAMGLAIVDTIRGADFQTRHILLALQAGEPYRVACALAAEAGFAAAEGGPARARTERLVREAERLAVQVGHPNALGFAAFAAGTADYLVGKWRSALTLCDRADAIFRERCAGVTWWIDTIQYFALECLAYSGNMAELCRRVPLLLENAQARGDLYAATNLQIGIPNMCWIVKDEVEAARRHVIEGMSGWSHAGFHIQHVAQKLAEGQTDLYLGDGASAHRRVVAAWGAITGAIIFRVQLTRIATYHQRARAALSAATAAGSTRRALVDDARRCASKIAGEHMAWADPLAALVRAGVRHLQGDDERARSALEEAVRGFDATDMALYAHAARRRHGMLVGGDAGADEVARADAWMRAMGIKRPDRMVAMLAPGF